MGIQKSIIKLTGTIGGINYYQIKKKHYFRKAGGGFNGKRIKNDPNMELVRQNGSEFGQCSRIKRVFLNAFRPIIGNTIKKEVHSDLTGTFVRIKNLDPLSERGKRRVHHGLSTGSGRLLLSEIDFGFVQKKGQRLLCSSQFDLRNQTLTLDISEFSSFKFPKYASHLLMELYFFDLDFETPQFTKHLVASAFIPIQTQEPIELKPPQIIPFSHIGLAAVRLKYCKRHKEGIHPCEETIGFKVLSVS